MKIAIHAPLGVQSQEYGLLMATATYLRSLNHEVVQLLCDGAAAQCDRDGENNWSRQADSCLTCMREQCAFSGEVKFERRGLSEYLSPEDIAESARLFAWATAQQLRSVNFRDIDLVDLCESSLRARFGTVELALKSEPNIEKARGYLLSSWRVLRAGMSFVSKARPNLIIVAGGRDHISASLTAGAKLAEGAVSLFQWEIASRSIKITHPQSAEQFSSDFLLTDPIAFRADLKSWPPDLIKMLDQLLHFLDIPTVQMPLFGVG